MDELTDGESMILIGIICTLVSTAFSNYAPMIFFIMLWIDDKIDNTGEKTTND